jgi:hypothetical protein
MGFFDGWTTKDFLTGVLALWGSSLSTYQFVVTSKAKRPKVKVKFGIGHTTKINGELGGMVIMSATNHGERQVILGWPHILHKWQKGAHEGIVLENEEKQKYPMTLQPGQTASFAWDVTSLVKELTKWDHKGRLGLRLAYGDSLGRSYLSDVVSFDIDEWKTAKPIGPMEWMAETSYKVSHGRGEEKHKDDKPKG